MRLNLWPIILFAALASAQEGRWAFFHAEAVTALSYKVEVDNVILHGSNQSEPYYVCHAIATRNDASLGNWEAQIGHFPATLKGRHAAEKVCSKWMDEASKRVKAAHR